jgi:hypothetical protein
MTEEILLKKPTADEFLKAINNPSIPKVYANGFMNGVGNADSTIIFQWNGNPVLVLNLSFTIAKTLALRLGQMIKDVESGSGNQIMIVDEIAAALGHGPKKEQP